MKSVTSSVLHLHVPAMELAALVQNLCSCTELQGEQSFHNSPVLCGWLEVPFALPRGVEFALTSFSDVLNEVGDTVCSPLPSQVPPSFVGCPQSAQESLWQERCGVSV